MEKREGKRRKCLRALALMLCACMVVTACPGMPGTVSVQAAEVQDGQRAAVSAESGKSAYMSYSNKKDSECFNIKGIDNNREFQTTFMDRGYRTASSVDGEQKVCWNSASGVWGRVTGADGYSVYVQYCTKNFSAKSLNQVKSGKKTKITVKNVNGKKLDTTKNFKLYVVAWQWENGKKITLSKTLTIHIAGKNSVKYTNVKKIKVKKSSYTLEKDGTVTLRPKAVLYDKRKKQLPVDHAKEFRYLSSNKNIATVTAGGKVKAKGTGECMICIVAKNGCKRKIKIRVRE